MNYEDQSQGIRFLQKISEQLNSNNYMVMYKITQYIRMLDIYGQPIQLHYKSATTFKTTLGGLVSLVTLGIILILLYIGLTEIYTESTYKVSLQQELYFQNVVIEKETISFTITPEIPNLSNRQLFNISVQYNGQDSLTMEQCGQVNIQICLKYQNLYCVPRLELLPTLAKDHYLILIISKCLDTTKCFDWSEIKHIPYFQIQFQIKAQQLDSVSNKLIDFSDKSIQFYFSPQNFQNEAVITLQQNQFILDKTMIPLFNDILVQNYLTIRYDQCSKQQLLYIKDIIQYAEIKILMSPEKGITLKEYQRVDVLLAYIGGISKLLMAVFGVIVKQYNMQQYSLKQKLIRYSFYLSLSNQIYIFNVQLKNHEFSYDKFIKSIKIHIEQGKKVISNFKHHTAKLLRLKELTSRQKPNYQNYDPPSINPPNRHKPPKGVQSQKEIRNQLIVYDEFQVLSESNEQPTQKPYIFNQNKKMESAMDNQYMSHISIILRDTGSHRMDVYHDRTLFLEYAFRQMIALQNHLQNHLRMIFSYILSRLFCKRLCYVNNVEVQLIHQAITMTQNYTDIAMIIERLQEIDKLKQILLSEEQQKVFDFTPKPIVTCTETGHLIKTNIYNEKNKSETNRKVAIINQLSVFKKKTKFKSIKSLHKLKLAYQHLLHESASDEYQRRMNCTLMNMIGKDLNEVFLIAQALPEGKPTLQKKNTQNIL